MIKIDKRKNYCIVLDTETCPLDNTIEAVDPLNMWAYDIGWAVVDKYGNVYCTKSYIVDEIFNDEKDLMKSSYYANKIPQYLIDIYNGSRTVDTLYNIRKALFEDIATYNIKDIYAHNMRFDLGALNNTIRWVTKSAHRYFFPWSVNICDTLKMSRQVISHNESYKEFCKAHGFITKNNQVRLTAEILYQYITQDLTFKESHTALEDVMIEKEILKYCYAKHKKMDKLLYSNEAGQ